MEHPQVGERIALIGGAPRLTGTVIPDPNGGDDLAIRWGDGDGSNVERSPLWNMCERVDPIELPLPDPIELPDPNDVDAVVAFLLQAP